MIKVANLNISQDNCGLYVIRLKGTDAAFFRVINNELWFTLQQPNICKTSYTVIVSVEDLAGRFTPLTRTFTLNTPNCFCTSTTTTLFPNTAGKIILLNSNQIYSSRSVSYDARNAINLNNWIDSIHVIGMWLELEKYPLSSASTQNDRLWEAPLTEQDQLPLRLHNTLTSNIFGGSFLYQEVPIQTMSDYLYSRFSLSIPERARLRMSISNGFDRSSFVFSVFSDYFDIRPTTSTTTTPVVTTNTILSTSLCLQQSNGSAVCQWTSSNITSPYLYYALDFGLGRGLGYWPVSQFPNGGSIIDFSPFGFNNNLFNTFRFAIRLQNTANNNPQFSTPWVYSNTISPQGPFCAT